MLQKIYSEILNYFPIYIKKKFVNVPEEIWDKAKEIRIRNNKPIMIYCFDDYVEVDHFATVEDILRLIENFSENSLYKVQNEINSGFLTIRGGHRIGLSGTSIIEKGEIKNIKYISSLNIRIAREVKECSDKILNCILENQEDNNVLKNTIIISPPGCGKTTLLRDIIRRLSDGDEKIKPQTIGLVDERSEIAAMYMGQAQNDIGLRTDVMDACKKNIAMKLMIRSMGPDFIATDEIGTKEDMDAILDAVSSGINLLVTCHGNSVNDIPKDLLEKKIFENVVILSKAKKPGNIEKIYKLKGEEYVSVY